MYKLGLNNFLYKCQIIILVKDISDAFIALVLIRFQVIYYNIPIS